MKRARTSRRPSRSFSLRLTSGGRCGKITTSPIAKYASKRNSNQSSSGWCSISTLLYGRKAITYVRGADEPPVSMEMKTMSTGFEMPRLQIIDPVGLDWLIRILRLSVQK